MTHVHLTPLPVVLVALAIAAPAQGQEPGVTIDPSGPSSKEYAIPLQTARSNAAGQQRTSSSSSGKPAPLFGVGVHTDPKPQRSAAARGHRPAAREHPVRHPRAAPAAPIPAKSTSAAMQQENSGSATASWGLAAAVLLLGGGLGSIARRYRRSGA